MSDYFAVLAVEEGEPQGDYVEIYRARVDAEKACAEMTEEEEIEYRVYQLVSPGDATGETP